MTAADATALSNSKLATDVSYAVQRKALSAARQEGAAIVSLIEGAAKIGKFNQTDELASAATGRGSRLDVYA